MPAAGAGVRPPAHTLATGATAGHRPAVGTPAATPNGRSESHPARAGRPCGPEGVRDGLDATARGRTAPEIADAIGATRPVDPNGRTDKPRRVASTRDVRDSADAIQGALAGIRQLDRAAMRADVAAQPDQPSVIELPERRIEHPAVDADRVG